MRNYDVAIVGAGPSGLMAAYELSKRFGDSISIGLFDKGNNIEKRVCGYSSHTSPRCLNCNPCNMVEGIMGAGMKSDGKVHFHKGVMELYRCGLMDEPLVGDSLSYIEKCFRRWGLGGPVYPISTNQASELSIQVKELNLGNDFELKVKQRTMHIGSDCLPIFVSNMINETLSLGNVDINILHELVDYDFTDKGARLTFQTKSGKSDYSAKKTILGFGRRGAPSVQGLIERLGISHSYRPVEMGGRVEVPAEVMDRVTNVIYNPCFRQKKGDLATFTFCTNPRGFLTSESLISGVVGVNGEGLANRKSDFTNFAILTEIPIPIGGHPNDVLLNLLQSRFKGGVPSYQTTKDFVNGTDYDREFKNGGTLENKTYRNLAEAFPSEIVSNLKDFLLNLDTFCPGVISEDSFFVAPEAKIRGIRVDPKDLSLETDVPNLHLIGDSSGLSGNIVAAALTGLTVARNISIH